MLASTQIVKEPLKIDDSLSRQQWQVFGFFDKSCGQVFCLTGMMINALVSFSQLMQASERMIDGSRGYLRPRLKIGGFKMLDVTQVPR
jgi:hypothetical protein